MTEYIKRRKVTTTDYALNARRKRAIAAQLRARYSIEARSRAGVLSALNSLTGAMVSSVLQTPSIPGLSVTGYAVTQRRDELKKKLLEPIRLMFKRALLIGSTFTRSTMNPSETGRKNIRFYGYDWEIKTTNDWKQIKSNDFEARVSAGVRKRVDAALSKWVDKYAGDIASSVTRRLQDAVPRIIRDLERSGIARGQITEEMLRPYVVEYYRKMARTTSNLVAVNGTTRGIENGKIIEATQIANELADIDPDDIEDEDEQELLDELNAMAGEGDFDAADLIAGGLLGSAVAINSIVKVWNAVIDESTRDSHAEADGQEVTLFETFSVGGEDLDYPGDPDGEPGETYNCRCTVTFDIG